jgi:hypothetical protein
MKLSTEQSSDILSVLKARFEKNMNRHPGHSWSQVQIRLEANPEKLWSLFEMERTGGEPDVVAFDEISGAFTFFDCAPESPAGRRSICYDKEGLDSRKEFKPDNTVIDMAAEMGIDVLTEEEYRQLQSLGHFDAKTSSWLKTPSEIRKYGGAIFGDYRYGHVFVYHNGAQSYYGGMGFRGMLKV